MGTTAVAICNRALDAAHARSSIAAIGEASAEGKACSRQFQPALEAVLRAAHWNFARRQTTLALLQDSTATPPGNVPTPWVYEYAYPSDCVFARGLLPTLTAATLTVPTGWSTPSTQAPPAKFIVANDADANGNDIAVILSNMPQAQLVYTRRVTNAALYDGEFEEALVAYLGARLAATLTGDKALAKDLLAMADQLTRNARARNGNESLTVVDQVPDFIRVRGYMSDWAYPPGVLWWYEPVDLQLVV